MADTWLIDLGSSRLKWQVRSPLGAVRAGGDAAWSTDAPPLPRQAPQRVWLARVGPPEREQILCDWIRQRHGPVPVFAVRPQPRGPGGLTLAYDCRQLGVDRYCALLGVLAQSRAPAVVIDAGTAVTVDLLAADGQHQGGYILPGLHLGLSAVTALLPAELQTIVRAALSVATAPNAGRARDGRSDHAMPSGDANPRGHGTPTDAASPRGHGTPAGGASRPGHDTAEALYRGWLHGWAAAVERVGAGAGSDAQWWLTGGDATTLAGLLERPVRVEPDLVFDGLWLHAGQGSGDPAAPNLGVRP